MVCSSQPARVLRAAACKLCKLGGGSAAPTACPPAQPTDWTIKMNKKEKRLAMATALQSAAGSITVVDDVQARARLSAAADLRLRM